VEINKLNQTIKSMQSVVVENPSWQTVVVLLIISTIMYRSIKNKTFQNFCNLCSIIALVLSVYSNWNNEIITCIGLAILHWYLGPFYLIYYGWYYFTHSQQGQGGGQQGGEGRGKGGQQGRGKGGQQGGEGKGKGGQQGQQGRGKGGQQGGGQGSKRTGGNGGIILTPPPPLKQQQQKGGGGGVIQQAQTRRWEDLTSQQKEDYVRNKRIKRFTP